MVASGCFASAGIACVGIRWGAAISCLERGAPPGRPSSAFREGILRPGGRVANTVVPPRQGGRISGPLARPAASLMVRLIPPSQRPRCERLRPRSALWLIFARTLAAAASTWADIFRWQRRPLVRLHDKGGKLQEPPSHAPPPARPGMRGPLHSARRAPMPPKKGCAPRGLSRLANWVRSSLALSGLAAWAGFALPPMGVVCAFATASTRPRRLAA
jgi:hypothetical protein